MQIVKMQKMFSGFPNKHFVVFAGFQVTNDFSFVFCAVGCHPLRHVEPESLREAVQYLAAHRYEKLYYWGTTGILSMQLVIRTVGCK